MVNQCTEIQGYLVQQFVLCPKSIGIKLIWLPSGNLYMAIEAMAIETVSFPIIDADYPYSCKRLPEGILKHPF